jgi:tRNA (guanine37-N1)-methyltransferase
MQLRAPLARAMTTLDRSLFSKTFQLAAAAVRDPRNISRYRKSLVDEGRLFSRPNFSAMVPHPEEELAKKGRKLLLLNPEVKSECAYLGIFFMAWPSRSAVMRFHRRSGF